MTAEPMTLNNQRLRAPKEDGEHLQIPPLEQCAAICNDNSLLLHSHGFELDKQDIQQIRRSARRELIEKSVAYSSRYRDTTFDPNLETILMAGHQPALFHPGVWYKNFALGEMAQRSQGIGINLVIDNDLCASCQIAVPTGTLERPLNENIAYDRVERFLPYEMCRVMDLDLWSTFADRVSTKLAPFEKKPLVNQLWPQVVDARKLGLQAPYAVAAGRHRLESQFGLQTLEIPLNQVCDTAGFAAFVAELIGRSRQLREIHNRCLIDYRREHRLRSHSHPVPELPRSTVGLNYRYGFGETMTRRVEGCLFATAAIRIDYPIPPRGKTEISFGSISEQIQALRGQGIRIRPRALTNTMYARLVLSDVFLHGMAEPSTIS